MKNCKLSEQNIPKYVCVYIYIHTRQKQKEKTIYTYKNFDSFNKVQIKVSNLNSTKEYRYVFR